jgi:hypothetical protein
MLFSFVSQAADEKLIFVDYQMLVIGWIAANDWRP